MSCLSVEFEKFNFQVGTAKIDKNRYSAGKSWNLQNLRGSVNSAISAASAESRIPMGTEKHRAKLLSVWVKNQIGPQLTRVSRHLRSSSKIAFIIHGTCTIHYREKINGHGVLFALTASFASCPLPCAALAASAACRGRTSW